MSLAPKKQPPPGAAGRANGGAPPAGATSSRSPSRTGQSLPATPNGVRRNNSTRGAAGTPVSARASVKKPATSSNLIRDISNAVSDDAETAREETAALINDLKEQLAKTEAVSEEYQKQAEVLQSRLDDAVQDQANLEERVHEEEERNEGLKNDLKESVRQKRELESIYEAERAATMKEKEEAQTREDELHGIVQRLKEGMAHREARPGMDESGKLSRNPSFRNNSRNSSSQNLEDGQFAPPAALQRSDSRNNSKLIHQKDKLIESLRLELAEFQIKLAEMENMGGGKVQSLEKTLLETRMANARLMEDNESFQLLLSEKTLNGDFSKGDFMRVATDTEERAPSRSGPKTSLADELESAEDPDTNTNVHAEQARRLENEVKDLQAQNKALSLYVNKIIERVLQHQGFEAVLDKTAWSPENARDVDKDLPPPPPPKDNAPSLLQRAKSITMGNGGRRARPQSYMPPPSGERSISEGITVDPSTAPSIPLQRSSSQRQGHRRTNSEMAGAASIVSNMYRPTPTPLQGGPGSPTVLSPRNSFFGQFPAGAGNPNAAAAAARIPSGTSTGAPPSVDEERLNPASTETASNADSGINIDTPSPPRSVASSADRGGAVMIGNKPRPLRLVQEAAEEDEVKKKKDNRQSWMAPAALASWFGGANRTGDRMVSSEQ